MKKIILTSLILSLVFSLAVSFAEDTAKEKAKFVLLISEQNIESPQRCWWSRPTEIDLSVTETAVARILTERGYEVLEPSSLQGVIKQSPAFRMVNMSQGQSLKIGSLAQADYVIAGKSIASSGEKIPQSNMRSFFANTQAKLIRVRDGKVIAYLDASGKSAHVDMVSGGRDALTSAGLDLARQVIEAVAQEGGRQK